MNSPNTDNKKTHCGESSPTEPAPWGIIPHRIDSVGNHSAQKRFRGEYSPRIWFLWGIFPTEPFLWGMIPRRIGSVGNDSPRSRFCGGWFPTVRFVCLWLVSSFDVCFVLFFLNLCVMFLDFLELSVISQLFSWFLNDFWIVFCIYWSASVISQLCSHLFVWFLWPFVICMLYLFCVVRLWFVYMLIGHRCAICMFTIDVCIGHSVTYACSNILLCILHVLTEPPIAILDRSHNDDFGRGCFPHPRYSCHSRSEWPEFLCTGGAHAMDREQRWRLLLQHL